eukprot:6051608-Amphidinium_carterae.1
MCLNVVLFEVAVVVAFIVYVRLDEAYLHITLQHANGGIDADVQCTLRLPAHTDLNNALSDAIATNSG